MKPYLALLLLALLLLCGCAHFTSEQTETRTEGTNTVILKSQQRITTFFDSKTGIAKMRVSRTEKTTGITVGGFEQESSGSNVVGLIESVSKGATKGALEYLAPKP